ncbi:MAG: hypothetical protein ABEJ62_01050 [Candidatus Nanohaloarchaea archaeon]
MRRKGVGTILAVVVFAFLLVALALTIRLGTGSFLGDFFSFSGKGISQEGKQYSEKSDSGGLGTFPGEGGSNGGSGSGSGKNYDYDVVEMCESKTTTMVWKKVSITNGGVSSNTPARTAEGCSIGLDSFQLSDSVTLTLNCGGSNKEVSLTDVKLKDGSSSVSFSREDIGLSNDFGGADLSKVKSAVKSKISNNLDPASVEGCSDPKVKSVSISESGWSKVTGKTQCAKDHAVYSQSCNLFIQNKSGSWVSSGSFSDEINATLTMACRRQKGSNCAAIRSDAICCQESVTEAGCTVPDSCKDKYIGGSPSQFIKEDDSKK